MANRRRSEVCYELHPDSDLNAMFAWAHGKITAAWKGGSVMVILCRSKKTREQEKKLNAMIVDISRTVIPNGNRRGFDVWKTLLVDQFEQERLSINSPLNNPSKAVVSLDGLRALSVRPSTTKFLVTEASDFIEFLYMWGAENGATWSKYEN